MFFAKIPLSLSNTNTHKHKLKNLHVQLRSRARHRQSTRASPGAVVAHLRPCRPCRAHPGVGGLSSELTDVLCSFGGKEGSCCSWRERRKLRKLSRRAWKIGGREERERGFARRELIVSKTPADRCRLAFPLGACNFVQAHPLGGEKRGG